ncbi:MAG TPA: MFS transporter [Opitutus sp.]|nr:MFS transporter [Opitutus sp.]
MTNSGHAAGLAPSGARGAGGGLSPSRVYWTAFIGLFFDYYDLYLFVYLEKVLAAHFGLSVAESNALQFTGLAGVGLGALAFGFLADRFGRGRMMLVVFGVYVLGIGGLSVAWDFGSVLAFRLVASLALGAEWGISHAFMSENVGPERRYRYAAWLQFSILGGLLAALATRYVLPEIGWRWLFAGSLVPIVALSAARWRFLVGDRKSEIEDRRSEIGGRGAEIGRNMKLVGPFLRCLGIASLTIASGTVNVFFAKELPQSPLYTVLFWANVAPGMLLGAWVVRRLGVRRALIGYAVALLALSAFAWTSEWDGRKLAFALVLPLLNGVPFGLMGAYFNEVFARYRTMLSGGAYNLGRILAGFSPVLVTALGLHTGGHYFLFTAAIAAGVLVIGWEMAAEER